MKHKAIITVKGQMAGENGDAPQTVELVTEGIVYEKEGKTYITYHESEVTGMDGTRTLIKVAPEKIVISRTGTINSQMIFEAGKRNDSYYDTQYGGFTISIHTLAYQVACEDQAVAFHVLYELDFNGAPTGENSLSVRAEKVEGRLQQ